MNWIWVVIGLIAAGVFIHSMYKPQPNVTGCSKCPKTESTAMNKMPWDFRG